MRIIGKLFLFFALSILWASLVHAESLDRIVATVNGDIILYSELTDQIQRVQKINPQLKTDDPAKKSEMEREMLHQMIREKLADQELKRLKLGVTERDVDEAIDSIKKDKRITEAQLEETIKKEGQTKAQFREFIRKEIERGRLMDRAFKSKVLITKEQVDAYAKGRGAELAPAPAPLVSSAPVDERHRLGVIFIPVPEDSKAKDSEKAEKTAREIHKRIKGGDSFAAMAKQYSKGPAADQGGDVGFVESDELAPYLAAAIKGLKKNDLADVVKGPNGFYLVMVLDVEKGKAPAQARVQAPTAAGDPGDREKIRRQLFQQEVNRKFEEWVRDLESRAFIKISL